MKQYEWQRKRTLLAYLEMENQTIKGSLKSAEVSEKELGRWLKHDRTFERCFYQAIGVGLPRDEINEERGMDEASETGSPA